jgi:predicted regulator of Ras-like GTPase activity (Roadblock/LC7/MglB family)
MFEQILREIAGKMEEVRCILVAGNDGIPIEKVILDQTLNIELLLAEFSTILRNTAQTAQEIEAGRLEEIIILSDRMILLVKAITQEYFLMMILPHDGNLGRARYELKKAKYQLEKEFV